MKERKEERASGEGVKKGGIWWPFTAKWPPEAVVDVVIPALNEEKSLPLVLKDLPWEGLRQVVVADNGSSDRTAEVAREGGALVVREEQRGYGAACLKALELLRRAPPEIVVFLDGDYSDYPEELPRVVAPIEAGDAEMVIGSRILGDSRKGALLPQAVFGNQLAGGLMALMYDYQFTDLGPFRAIRWETLEMLGMEDQNYGWTVEMQVKAARMGISTVEVPVSYRKRVGVSKVTGTIRGTVLASYKILFTLWREYLDEVRERRGRR